MPRNGAHDDSNSTDSGFKPSRRSYLKAAGAAAVSVPLLTGEGAAATERHGISFDNVVEVDSADAIESEAADNTLLKFSSGTYNISGQTNVSNKSNFGIIGEGDVTFTVPDDYDGKILNINGGNSVLVENITIDQSNATPCVQVAPDDDLQVHGLEMMGEGISSATSGHGSGGSEAIQAFSPMVRSSSGSGTIQDIVLHNEGRMGAYSRVGVWIGEGNKGTLTLRDCNVEGFSGNGIYGSRTSGEVHVEGGLYKNNDLSQVRIGSQGSYVDGVSAVVDTSESRSDNPGEMLNGSGIRIESGERSESGAAVRNCDIDIGSNANADSGIKVFGNYGGDVTVENTRISIDCAGYGLRASSPDDSSGDTSITLKNVSVTGDATSLVGIEIEDRDGTTIEDCCVQTSGSRKGIYLKNCGDSSISNTTVNAGGKNLQLSGSDVSQSNISYSGSCPAPSTSSSDYSGASVSSVDEDSSSDDSSSDGSSDDSDSSESDDSSSDSSSDDSDSSSSDDSSSDSSSDDSSSDSSSDDSSSDDSSGNSDGSGSDDSLSGDIDESDVPEPSGGANLVITDTSTQGDRVPYHFTTSGDVEKAGTGDATQDDNDEISGTSVSGGVQSYRDAYEYEGELVSLDVEDYATIKLDKDAGTITVMGEDESGTDYSLEVTGTLTHADDSSDPISDDGHSVSGGVGSFRDTYDYTGDLVQASIEDSVSITTDPDTLDN